MDSPSTSTGSNASSLATGVSKTEESIRKLLSNCAAAVDNVRIARNECCASTINFEGEKNRMAIVIATEFYTDSNPSTSITNTKFNTASTDPFKNYQTVVLDFHNNLKEIEGAFFHDFPRLEALGISGQ